jgi:hypothetical protein
MGASLSGPAARGHFVPCALRGVPRRGTVGVMRLALLALVLAGCCLSGLTRPGGATLRYTPDPWLVNWGAGYEPALLADGDPSTYWCTPSGAPLPITGLMQLDVPSSVASIDFDNRVTGYETSGAREVTVELVGAGGVAVAPPVHAVLNANALTTLPVVGAGVSAVRLTILSNYGGSYTVLSELAIRSDLGTGMPPLPGVVVPPVPPPSIVPPSAPPIVPPVPSAPPVPSSAGVPYVTDAIPSYGGYGPELMRDGSPSTYWCTPARPELPVIVTLTFAAPTTISAVQIDSAIPGYTDIGPSDVTFLARDAAGTILGLTNGRANANAVTVIPLAAPVTGATVLRVTFQEYYGGAYLGVGELVVIP